MTRIQPLSPRAAQTGVPDATIADALQRERSATVGTAAAVRFGGAIAFFLVILVSWRVTGQQDWYVYLSPMALYTAIAAVLLAFRGAAPTTLLTWCAALADVWAVYFMQSATLPDSPYPAGVAGFSLGLFALVIVLTSLGMRLGPTLAAAISATACQCDLMRQAHVAPGPMVAAGITLLLVALASHSGSRRVWLLARRSAQAESERLAASQRLDALATAREQIRSLLIETQASNEHLRQVQHDRDELANALVHDLRTPLTSLHIYLQSLDRQLRKAGAAESWRGNVERSLETTERLGSMVAELLDIAQLEEGRLLPEPVPLAVADVLPASCLDSAATPGRARVQLDDEPGAMLHADRNLLRRVVENLVSNAFRYTPATGHVLVRTQHDDRGTILSIHNDGDPIPDGLRARLFSKFERGIHETRRGWGLGLYFCKLAVEAHGGTIALEDHPGWSVSFVIRMPHRAVSPAPRVVAS